MSSSLAQLRLKSTPEFAIIKHLKPLPKYEQEKPYILGYGIPLQDESTRNNLEFEEKKVAIYDARGIRDELSVEKNGFELLSISRSEIELHFQDSSALTNLQGVELLLEKRFETEHVFCYDHAICQGFLFLLF